MSDFVDAASWRALLLVLLVGAAAVTDLRNRRIPNLLTVTGFALALALRSASGWEGLADGLQGAGLALLVTVPLFAVRALGGGDVKLLAAVGALLGPGGAMTAMLLSAAIGWVLALVAVVRRGVLLPVLMNCGDMVRYWVSLGRAGRLPRLDSPDAASIPYGVAIALGSAGALML